MQQRLAEQRRHGLGGRRIALRQLPLVHAGLREHLPDKIAVGIRQVGHRDPDDPRGVEHAILGQPRVQEELRPLGGLQIRLAVDALLVGRNRRPERPHEPDQEVVLEAGAGCDLLHGVALGPLLEDALNREQDQAVLLDRALQLLERDTVLRQVLEQREPRLARLPGEAVEQAFGLEVDAGLH